MCCRYSSRVVAPIQCSSPRANIGLSMLPASIAPSDLPAPTIVCSSSINSKIRPSLDFTSARTALRRSSNSPRYLAPAISEPISRAKMVLFLSPAETSPRTMRCARPSTIAVLPTPGSPISTGLFLVLRDRMRTTRRISSSRPITGSILPLRACLSRSIPYLSSASKVASGLRLLIFLPLRNDLINKSTLLWSSVNCSKNRPSLLLESAHNRPSNKCSVLTNSSRNLVFSSSACEIAC